MNKVDEKRELLVLGNFVGRLLDGFPVVVRSKALKEIEEAEERFCKKSSHKLRQTLAPALWRIEHNRRAARDPRLRKKIILGSFGDTIEEYLSFLHPMQRVDILRAICDIVSHHGSEHRKD
nr:uncharacterized protein LOC112211152 [Halyomorpha halys]